MKGRPRVRARNLRWVAAVALLVLLAGVAQLNRPGPALQPPGGFNAPELSFSAADRILILAPHPDDETIACGGVIQKAIAMGLPVRVVFLTYGDNNEWSFALYRRRPELLPGQVEAMGLVRHDEALAAAGVLGLRPEQLTFLGYPDFGTLRVWTSHWGAQPPLRSMLTRVTQVPYANAYRPGAAYKGEEVLADLETILKDFQPTKVFLSHPADHNPDHLALYTFTRVALWDLGMTPELYPYLVHAPPWPEPRGQAPARPLAPPASLTGAVSWWTSPLSSEEIGRKLIALEAHRTQYEANPRYLPSFIRANELFGDFPETTLHAESADIGLVAGEPGTEAPEELTDAERAAFVGLEWHTVRRAGNALVLSVALSKPLAEGVALSAYLFGYRPDKPFAAMPKIRVKVGTLSQVVYDQDRALGDTGVQVSRDAHDIVLRVPLALLGDPDRALVYARTYLGDLPLDSAAWRVLDLPGD
ncbi:MAG: PIG-L family deacetylase [Chloroflexi bacterium]|nr:PIG-L family deacetylase [Chloroflexota bacterium]